MHRKHGKSKKLIGFLKSHMFEVSEPQDHGH